MEPKRRTGGRTKTSERCYPQVKGVICLLACASLCISVVISKKMPPPADLTYGSASNIVRPVSSIAIESAGSAIYGEEHLINLCILDGNEIKEITMRDGIVSDALKQAGIVLGEFDEINYTLNSHVYQGIEIKIIRVTVTLLELYESIPFETVKKANSKLLTGTTLITQNGREGKLKKSYDIVYRNGVESDRILFATGIASAPVDKVIEYGTKLPDNNNAGPYTLTLPSGKKLSYTQAIKVVATAYSCENQENNITASGTIAKVGVIAVDPRVIPLGSRMYIMAEDGSWIYGYAVAEDTGGFIKGNRIDLYYDTINECINFGRKKAIVYILD